MPPEHIPMKPCVSARENTPTVLALNLGSSSLKAATYAQPSGSVSERPAAQRTGRVSLETTRRTPITTEHDARQLLDEATRDLPELREPPAVVAHRIVHGADAPGPAELTHEKLAQLDALSALAPLHQPPALALVRAAIERWPNARQIGVFDTSWHQTIPEKHRLFALPYALYSSGVKRYGFHGLAFQSAMRQLGTIAPPLTAGRVVLAHLGGGSSLCAVRNERCVNTTMGMTPLGGIPMASRSGSLDPGVLLHLQRKLSMDPAEIDQLLWHESGLYGLSGESGDMRKLLASGSEGARRAIDVYVSAVVQAIASMAACVNGIDALVFSGGIGAHAAEIRARVVGELGWMGLEIDAGSNLSGASAIASAGSLAGIFAVAVDEEEEMLGNIAMLPSEK